MRPRLADLTCSIAIGVSLAACGSSGPAAGRLADGSVDAAAPPDASGPAAGCLADGSVDAAAPPDASGKAPPAPCEADADQSCNDDPAVSALWGTCGVSGACVCKDGFSLNPATGRCRLGNTCEASAADWWSVVLRLDSQNCTMPDTVACESDSGTADDVATEEVRKIVASCMLPPHTRLRVEVVFGCPVRLDLDQDLTGSTALQCVTKILRSSRWSCAGDMACALIESDAPP
jgi:hypothetical protein